MFAAFFRHADTESYANIQRSCNSIRRGNFRVSQKTGGENVREEHVWGNVLHPKLVLCTRLSIPAVLNQVGLHNFASVKRDDCNASRVCSLVISHYTDVQVNTPSITVMKQEPFITL